MPFVIEYLRHLRDVDLDGRDVGSLLVYDGETWVPIVAGEDGEALVVASGEPVWGVVDTSVLADVDLEGKALGTLLVPSNGGWVVLPAGADGQQLTIDSNEDLGLKWADPQEAEVGTGWVVVKQVSPFGTDTVEIDLPAGYAHLRIEWTGASDDGGSKLLARLNDASTGYDSYAEENQVDEEELGEAWGLVGYVTDQVIASGSIEVSFYESSFKKIVRWQSQRVLGETTGDLRIASGMMHWRSSNPVTKVTLALDSGEWVFGSKVIAEVRAVSPQLMVLGTGDDKVLTTGDDKWLVFGA